MPDLDLIDLITADHAELLALDEDDVVSAIVKHLTLERALLYPALERHLSEGPRIVAGMRAVDRALEESLERFQQSNGDVENAQVAKDLLAHIDLQGSPLALLRQSMGAAALQELADQAALVLEEAPTRVHPHLPDHGPLREPASEIAAVVDQARGSRHKESDREIE